MNGYLLNKCPICNNKIIFDKTNVYQTTCSKRRCSVVESNKYYFDTGSWYILFIDNNNGIIYISDKFSSLVLKRSLDLSNKDNLFLFVQKFMVLESLKITHTLIEYYLNQIINSSLSVRQAEVNCLKLNKLMVFV